MSAAWAASEGTAAAEHAFYQSAEFWVAVAFVMLMAAIGKTAYAKLVEALDMRAMDIKEQIDEAVKLREEAQNMLASFERKQRDAANEAKEIVERAQAEAARLAAHAAEELEKALKRREQLAMERISQAEAKAVEEVRTLAVDVTINATRQLLSEKISAKKTASMVDGAIEELPEKLN
ncbi:MAG TPA: F0F1 ATP synthase subunit B [Rhodospirillales bacterium]|nr:F0F1 ATP synthase subunit B [Rhodospirillales bacterium]